MSSLSREEALIGCLLGTAVGDAIGLPYEGLSPRRQGKMFADVDRHHLIFGRGMISDDTEHTAMAAQSLIVSAGDPEIFAADLSRRMKLWLLGVPAGIGLATLRSILKSMAGNPPDTSGVFSAGNGPAMRSAVLGVSYGDDAKRLRTLVRASTRLTHTDPKAEYGAYAVATAAWMAWRAPEPDPMTYYSEMIRWLGGLDGDADTLLDLIEQAAESALGGQDAAEFADRIGCANGVGGYIYQTVPMALWAWFRHPDNLREGVLEVVRRGGDTDTTAAITGAIIGARVGKSGIPADWLGGMWETPRSTQWLEALGSQVAKVVETGQARSPLPMNHLLLLPRNAVFLAAVLSHGFRRLLPPY